MRAPWPTTEAMCGRPCRFYREREREREVEEKGEGERMKSGAGGVHNSCWGGFCQGRRWWAAALCGSWASAGLQVSHSLLFKFRFIQINKINRIEEKGQGLWEGIRDI